MTFCRIETPLSFSRRYMQYPLFQIKNKGTYLSTQNKGRMSNVLVLYKEIGADELMKENVKAILL